MENEVHHDWNGRIFSNEVLSYLLVEKDVFIELKQNLFSPHDGLSMDCQ